MMFSMLLKSMIGLFVMAMYTLLERNFLGLCQTRTGPTKVGPRGLFQPMVDAMKLYLKSSTLPTSANWLGFLLMPMLALMLAIIGWACIPCNGDLPMYYAAFLLLIISGMTVYPILFSGWASNAKWSTIGSIRGMAQTVSYEVSMAFILMGALVFHHSMTLSTMSYPILVSMMLPALLCIWMLSLLAESNRSPYDLAEGESELVSGYNTEYVGPPFAILFMAEYLFILMLSGLTMNLFFSVNNSCLLISLAMSFLWVRASLPRLRVDVLMSMCWQIILPASITLLILASVSSFCGGLPLPQGLWLSMRPLLFY